MIGRAAAKQRKDRFVRLDVLDYSGHPCQAQLSRALAGHGFQVRHMFCSDYMSGRGKLSRTADDPETLTFESLSTGSVVDRYKVGQRLQHELRFARLASQRVNNDLPDILLVSNVPLLAHAALLLALPRRVSVVFWQQDVYSHAMADTLKKKSRLFGACAGWVADRVERFVARRSRAVVAITESFRPTLARWGISDRQVAIIPNWAALSEMPILPKSNSWARDNDLDSRLVLMYTGTLGLKHDPSRLLYIAKWLSKYKPESRLVVITQGAGRIWLEEARHNEGLEEQLVLLDYQPYEMLPEILASADIFVALLEPEAGVFSVPSKTLNYLCAGRPILGVMPSENLAARIIVDEEAGIVVPPSSDDRLRNAVEYLVSHNDARAAMGTSGRRYAEQTFDIEQISKQFETILVNTI